MGKRAVKQLQAAPMLVEKESTFSQIMTGKTPLSILSPPKTIRKAPEHQKTKRPPAPRPSKTGAAERTELQTAS